MKTKLKKISDEKVQIDLSLNKFKDKDLFPEKTKKFNEMIKRVGEDHFAQLTGSKKRN